MRQQVSEYVQMEGSRAMQKAVAMAIPKWIWCLVTAKQFAFLCVSVVCGFLAKEDAFRVIDDDYHLGDHDHHLELRNIASCVFAVASAGFIMSAYAELNKNTFICDKSVTADVFLRHIVFSLFTLFLTIPSWTDGLDSTVYVPKGADANGVMQFKTTTKYQAIAAPLLCAAFWLESGMTVQKGIVQMIKNVIKMDLKQVLFLNGKDVESS